MHEETACTPEPDYDSIRGKLLAWYKASKRDLPWRGADAYGVWVSEIMLQQTQVATVVPFYHRFMERFPTIAALAAAPIDDVLHCWSGLGYYTRARNLHRAASIILEHHNGNVPGALHDVLKLPGIGRYTAGAILSIAFGRRIPAVDANAIRVLCRLFGIAGDPKSPSVLHEIYTHAERLICADSPGDFNQALMELGALVCDSTSPLCAGCPVRSCCVANGSGRPTAFPQYAAPRESLKATHCCTAIRNCAGELLIAQRSAESVWGGLWEFPRVECLQGEPLEAAARRAAARIGALAISNPRSVKSIRHTVMHYRITLHAFAADSKDSNDTPGAACDREPSRDTLHGEYVAYEWAPLGELSSFALSSPQKRALSALLEMEGSLWPDTAANL